MYLQYKLTNYYYLLQISQFFKIKHKNDVLTYMEYLIQFLNTTTLMHTLVRNLQYLH